MRGAADDRTGSEEEAGSTTHAVSATLGGVPRPLTPLIGRHTEVTRVRGLLLADEVRLVTLTGPGGVGKTRLALHVADGLAREGWAAVRFVPLDALADPALILPAIGRALGVRDGGGRPLSDRIAAVLGTERHLLVLDTLEHLLEAAPQVSALLGRSPLLEILVTSRAILGVSGERVVPVAPLATPPPLSAPADDVSTYDAVKLFVARAGAVDPAFALSKRNAPAVADICRRLDGLPLAIELAAARTNVLPPVALLARLEQRLPLLTGGPRDQPARLRTMRDAIAWSYDLLRPEERRHFRRLAVFAGGFTLEGAEAVCGAEGGGRGAGEDGSAPPSTFRLPPSALVLDTVTSLLRHSLVQRQPGSDDAPRFAMLDTIRAYARERLVAEDEEAVAAEAHARYFLEKAEQGWPTAFARDLDEWLTRLDDDLANLRLALSWFEANGRAEEFLRLAAGLRMLCWVRGHAREGGAWLDTALRQAGPASDAVRAKALLCRGELALHTGDYAEAEPPLRDALALYRALDDRIMAAFALHALGLAATHLGAYDRAEDCSRGVLALARAAGEPRGDDARLTGFALFNLGMVALAKGELVSAETRLDEALRVQRQHGDRWGAMFSLWVLGHVAHDGGDEERARALYGESLGLARDFGDRQLLTYEFADIAGFALDWGRPERAAVLFGAAEALRDAIGLPLLPSTRATHERREAALRTRLDAQTIEHLWAEGRRLRLDEAIAFAFATLAPPRRRRPLAGNTAITRRERDVLRLLAEGLTDREIADALRIGRRTVEWHRTNLFNKFGVSTRAALVAKAVRDRLIG